MRREANSAAELAELKTKATAITTEYRARVLTPSVIEGFIGEIVNSVVHRVPTVCLYITLFARGLPSFICLILPEKRRQFTDELGTISNCDGSECLNYLFQVSRNKKKKPYISELHAKRREISALLDCGVHPSKICSDLGNYGFILKGFR